MRRAALRQLPVATSGWRVHGRTGGLAQLPCPEQPACLLCPTTLAAGESGLEFLCLGGSLAFAFCSSRD